MRFPSSAVFATAVVALVGTLSAAPVPKAVKKKFPDYYPLVAGSEWLYLMGQTEVTVKVSEFEGKDDAKTAKLVTLHDGKEVASEVIRVDADGVTRTQVNGTKVEPGVTVLKFGLADEEGWDVKADIQGSKVTGKFTLKGTEKLKVEAGTFDAVAVSSECTIAGTDTTIKYWFADGLGIVKMQYAIAGTESPALELKKYTPGKADKSK